VTARPSDIDRLYGLEPVFEPGEPATGEGGSDALESFAGVTCPNCGETFLARLDQTAGSQSYVEDCQVCCQPIQLSVHVDEAGRLSGVETERMDR
jgi:hypothetical protein